MNNNPFFPLLMGYGILQLSIAIASIMTSSPESDTHTSRNSLESNHSVYEYIDHESRFNKIKESPYIYDKDQVYKDIEERRNLNRTKLLPENLSKPLNVYGKH